MWGWAESFSNMGSGNYGLTTILVIAVCIPAMAESLLSCLGWVLMQGVDA